MPLASLLVAVLALIVAGASAFYARAQVKESRRQFEEAGSKVSVSCSETTLDLGGMGTRAIAVTARNDGRGPVTVSAWGLSFRASDLDEEFRLSGQRLQDGEIAPLGPVVPCELTGLDSLTWKAPLGIVAGRLRHVNARWMRPYVQLGSGEDKSGTPMWLPPDS